MTGGISKSLSGDAGGNRRICFIDQTLREGMQYRGLVFSRAEKIRILNFQEQLGVDICQGGYPPAHPSEAKKVGALTELAAAEGYRCRIAAMGRAFPGDVDTLLETGAGNFHLHALIRPQWDKQRKTSVTADIDKSVDRLRKGCPGCTISMALLDLGRTPDTFQADFACYLIHELEIDLLSLPDTSGLMAPPLFQDAVRRLVRRAENTQTRISVHCHNDLGMATANAVIGVSAGAAAVEVSALGIGERNGIADLYCTARALSDLGFQHGIRLADTDGFMDYYRYIDDICRRQTGESLLGYTTPFFGQGVSTHVAGTHAGTGFGAGRAAAYYLNVLCGRRLVQAYLESGGIDHPPDALPYITRTIKDDSARLGRRLHGDEIREICRFISEHRAGNSGPAPTQENHKP